MFHHFWSREIGYVTQHITRKEKLHYIVPTLFKFYMLMFLIIITSIPTCAKRTWILMSCWINSHLIIIIEKNLLLGLMQQSLAQTNLSHIFLFDCLFGQLWQEAVHVLWNIRGCLRFQTFWLFVWPGVTRGGIPEVKGVNCIVKLFLD